jgi:hypothetical protein
MHVAWLVTFPVRCWHCPEISVGSCLPDNPPLNPCIAWASNAPRAILRSPCNIYQSPSPWKSSPSSDVSIDCSKGKGWRSSEHNHFGIGRHSGKALLCFPSLVATWKAQLHLHSAMCTAVRKGMIGVSELRPTPWATPPALFCYGFFEIGTRKPFDQAGLKPQSSWSLPPELLAW